MSKTDGLEELGQVELARFAVDIFRRAILHYGMWFNEVQYQLGLEKAIQTEQEVFAKIFPIIISRLSKTMGFEVKDELPAFLLNMPREKIVSLINALSVNWLADDGIWFQAVENREDMDTAKRCNDTCWSRFSPLEGRMIKSFFKMPEQAGLDGLEKALKFRLYATINEQTIEREGNAIIFRMVKCRVQEARQRRGLPDYPCKSGGVTEYRTFAGAIDARLKTECLACPPDAHPAEWACAWRFYLE